MGRKSIEMQENEYWHFPTPCFLPLAGLLLFALLSYFNFFLLNWSWLSSETAMSFVFSDLVLVYPYFMEYLFVAGLVVSIVALMKGGYGNLKPYNEEGLIAGLIWGLIWGLIGGLVSGLIGELD